MTNDLSQRIRLLGPRATPSRALVLLLCLAPTDEACARRLAVSLTLAMPHTVFAPLEFEVDDAQGLPELDDCLDEMRLMLDLEPSQVVLVGWGPAARLALDAALQGAHAVCGVIAVDPPPDAAATAVRWGAVRVRLLQRASDDSGGRRLRALMEGFHARQVDVRGMLLPNLATTSEDTVLRAVEVFLVELVASASQAAERRDAQ